MTALSTHGDHNVLGPELAAWLAEPRPDPTPTEIDFDMADAMSKTTARDILQAWRACPDDAACDMLARLALDAVEEREATGAVLRASLAFNVEQNAVTDRLRRGDDIKSACPGPDITKDASYRSQVFGFLKRIGKLRPGLHP